MTRTEIIASVAKHNGLSNQKAKEVIDGFLTTVKNAVRSGQEVKIGDFGTFRKKTRAARMGINPATKEPMPHGPSDYVSFKASKTILK